MLLDYSTIRIRHRSGLNIWELVMNTSEQFGISSSLELGRRDLTKGVIASSLAVMFSGKTVAGAFAQADSSSTVTIPIASNPTADPLTSTTGLSGILLNKNLFSQLVRPDAESLQPSPDLAESWEISEDGLTYTFYLRDGLLWHDGEPVTSDDVKFTFDAILNPEVNAAFLVNMGPLSECVVVDETTVQLVLSEPFAPLLVMLCYNIMILPRKHMEDQDLNSPTDFLANPVGSGPYVFQEYVSGDHVTLTANPDYWDGAPQISTVVYKILPDSNTQVAQLRTGEIDLVMIEPSQSSALNGVENVVINTANQTNSYYMQMNLHNPLFQDKLVRQAMCYALDREAIVESVMQGQGSVSTGPISPPMDWAFPDDQEPFPFDPDKALELLAEAGWEVSDGKLTRNGETFSFKVMLDAGNPTRESIALAVQQFWTNLGMDVEIDTVDFNTWYSRSVATDYDSIVMWWITPPDPDALSDNYADDNGSFGWQNDEVDALFAEGRVTTLPEDRQPIYSEIQKRVYEEQPNIFIAYPLEFRAVSTRLEGLASVGVRDALYYTYKWTLAE